MKKTYPSTYLLLGAFTLRALRKAGFFAYLAEKK